MTLTFPVSIIEDRSRTSAALSAAVRSLVEALERHGTPTEHLDTPSAIQGSSRLFIQSSTIVFVIPQRDLAPGAAADDRLDELAELVQSVRAKNPYVPIYLFGELLTARRLPDDLLAEIEGVINAYEDTPDFVARTIERQAREHLETLTPPFFRALMKYANDAAYSWHCPGHNGGTAFLKSPVGSIFHDFFGEPMLRADVCSSVEDLGQLLGHSGPVAESERRAARTFGADRLFFVTNGTSTSNKIIWNSIVAEGDVVLVDRNCHKSILHAIMITGAIPIYLNPTRNRAGIIGPIPRSEFSRESIQAKIDANPFITDKSVKPRLMCITQSTYDGIVYNAAEIREMLDGEVGALHFDEAWLPHAAFHEFYRDMHAIEQDSKRTMRSPVYASQSTHKLLAGLSQASQILLRDAEEPTFRESIFNEAFLMHTSTSPQYAIIASCDVSAEMMAGPGGEALVGDALLEAVEFRRAMSRIQTELTRQNQWWFGVWGPESEPHDGLPNRAEWSLTPGASWHGFHGVDDGFTMLDPLKVTLTTPGLTVNGEFEEFGIPGPLLTAYLAEHGVVVEKTGLYSLFLLFTIGVTKGRWNSLIAELHRFKHAIDANIPLEDCMPRFAASRPQYAQEGIADLAAKLHAAYRERDYANLSTDIYLREPEMALLPGQAWNTMTTGKVENVPVDELAGRITSVLLTPYPPGIPLVVPGERIGAHVVNYLKQEEELERLFPGFGGHTHGLVDGPNGRTVPCIVED